MPSPAGPPITAAEFAARMDHLGPFEPNPRLAVAVSGGADSMALAILAGAWAMTRRGGGIALIVDHGLRPESQAEAAEAAERLRARRISARVLQLHGLARGPALAARARAARYTILTAACAEAGLLHLLLGHHAADQAETLMMRALSGSTPAGLAGMAALRETGSLRLLRPLLGVPPDRLRATLRAAGLGWAEDPSNADPRAQRARLRRLSHPDSSAAVALSRAAAQAGQARARDEARLAAELAEVATIHEAGFAMLRPGPVSPAALGALLRMVAGAEFAPSQGALTALAEAPRPATLGGARLMAAGRLGPGLLILREAAAMAPPVPARPGAMWDNRFRLAADARPEPGTLFGALGPAAARLRRRSHLPAAVLQTLPALWRGDTPCAVPHLEPGGGACMALFSPPAPAAGAPFVP